MNRKEAVVQKNGASDKILAFREKPLELRLKWLYMGNLLRMGYSNKVKEIQDGLREKRYE